MILVASPNARSPHFIPKSDRLTVKVVSPNAIASTNIGSTHEFHVNFDGLGDTVHGHLTHDLPVVLIFWQQCF